MKHTICICIALCAVSLLGSTAAADTPDTRIDEETVVGFGLGLEVNGIAGLNERGLLNVLARTVTIPIQLNSFRLEPSLKFLGFAENSSFMGSTSESSTSVLEAGVGGFYTVARERKVALHIGARLGVLSTSEKDEDSGPEPLDNFSDEDSAMDYFVRPTLGGELFLSRWFSLGAEFGLNVLILGDRTSESTFEGMTETNTDDSEGLAIYTQGGFFVRGYFR